MTILIVVQSRDPHRQAEGLRAALGVTLRGGRVEVVIAEPLMTPLAQRSAATLVSFGHVVGAELSEALARADVVEVWT